jgi:hypothetical protein
MDQYGRKFRSLFVIRHDHSFYLKSLRNTMEHFVKPVSASRSEPSNSNVQSRTFGGEVSVFQQLCSSERVHYSF